MSPRHVSFLETGRCGPSRDIILRLCDELDLEKVETQRMLQAAGLAADWTHDRISPNNADRLLESLSHMLDAHDPAPAFVTGPDWTVKLMNRGAEGFLFHCDRLGGGDGTEALCIRTLIATPERLPSIISNWNAFVEEIMVGLFLQDANPKDSESSAPLYEAIQRDSHPPGSEMRFLRERCWDPRITVVDGNSEFDMSLLAIPLTGIWHGYSLVICLPSEGSRETAAGYFGSLIDQHVSNSPSD